MTLSIWRYSHLLLAILTSAFILVVSITGAILAFEPMVHQAKRYDVENLSHVTVRQLAEALENEYDEVFKVEVESSGFVKAAVLTHDFESLDIYINPRTGENLGEVPKRAGIFHFATNLHRSLFLKSTGRLMVGIASLLMLIIMTTGMMLIVKRQGGVGRIFKKLPKEEGFEMRFHVIFARWLFIPLLILTLTGVYLSAERFQLIPETKIEFKENPPLANIDQPVIKVSEIPFFAETPLSHIKRIDFPFTDNEPYQIKLKDGEVEINPTTGQIVSQASYPFTKILSQASFFLHTGEGSPLWAGILLLTVASIFFFIYSGFAMSLKRRRKTSEKFINTPGSAEDSEYIILVGSETGGTLNYAHELAKSLTIAGKKVHIAELNRYTLFPKAKQLIILTATYGDGEAPTNARKFESLLSKIKQHQEVNYSVVGFGSKEYSHFCAFAKQIDDALSKTENFKRFMDIHTVNDNEFTEFKNWLEHWKTKTQINLYFPMLKPKPAKLKKHKFEIIERTRLDLDHTFMLKLKAVSKVSFNSGDLLSVIPPGSRSRRQYSIAKLGDEVVLSVKLHSHGKGSNFLFNLLPGDALHGYIEPNPDFHFPKNRKSAILIANGTGIGPFVGMVNENAGTPINLLWGTRTTESGRVFHEILEKPTSETKQILNIQRCFSREDYCRRYVQDLVKENSELIIENFNNDGVCMICGSLSMQNEVLDEIEKILKEKSNTSLDDIKNKGLLKTDCY